MQIRIVVEGDTETHEQAVDLSADCLTVAHTVNAFQQSSSAGPDSPEEAAIRLLIDYLQPLLTGLDDLAEQYRDEYGGSINEFAGYLSGQILRDQTIH